MNIERNEDRILIKYVDSNFNTYKCVITTDDVFVVNFCKGNLEKMEKILQNGLIIEMMENYMLKVEEPVCLEYVLHKEKNLDVENFEAVIEKFKKLDEENTFYKRKIQELESSLRNFFNILQLVNEQNDSNNLKITRIEKENIFLKENIENYDRILEENKELCLSIDKRFGNNIVLSGYAKKIIQLDCRTVYFCGNEQSDPKHYYDGSNLRNLTLLPELEEIYFNQFTFNLESIDLSALFDCKKLKKIELTGTTNFPNDMFKEKFIFYQQNETHIIFGTNEVIQDIKIANDKLIASMSVYGMIVPFGT